MAKSKFNIPFKVGTAMYQRALHVCNAHGGKPFDKLPIEVQQTIEREASSKRKTIVDASLETEVPAPSMAALIDSLDEIGFRLANIERLLKKKGE
jgi:hypothetical protein